ncbi:AMP-binding protein [Clostridiaceae bacterium OttesenSCG-928-D20]|nr:AMP-binding protein [Clostridiaceae bacterium OttesenSCG-928-D20]
MRNINLRYAKETYKESGMLDTYKLDYPESFNFGYDVVDDIALNDPNRRAMVWCNPQGEEKLFTFADMKKMSDKTANYFKSLGIEKGDMVMVVLKRHYEFWYTAVALHKLGAVLIPATFMLKTHDTEYRLNAAGVKAVVVTSECGVPEAVDECEKNCPTLKTKIIVRGEREGWSCFDTGIENADESFERVETNILEPMIMYFSSGTSGYPKMVLHDHTYALAHLFTAKHWHNVTPDGLHFTVADTGWGKAVWGKLYGQWLMEAGVFTYDFDKFVPSEILSLMEKYKVTTFCVPPTMYRLMLREDVTKYDLSNLSYCTTAGEAMPPEVFKAWYKATGIEIMEGFGQTETTVALCNIPGMKPKPGSLGKPSPQYRVTLMDADGDPCPAGVTGEIVISMKYERPDGLLNCYYLNGEKTAEVMRSGWYHTGDTAWMDEDGYYWFVGRNDDIIKSSGYRIGPFEIESVLIEHPAVSECAVTGVPDETRGQLVKATIVLMQGFEASEELKAELQAFVKKRTAPYKYPRLIDFVPELPKTVNGKVRRVEIRQNDEK